MKKISRFKVLYFVLLTITGLFATTISPDQFDPEENVTINQYVDKGELKAGDLFRVLFTLDIPEGYHITDSEYFSLSTEGAGQFGFSEPKYLQKEKYKDFMVYKNKVKILVTGKYPESLAKEDNMLILSYQICSELGSESCYMPIELEQSVNFTNVNSEMFAEFKDTVISIDNGSDEEGGLEEKLYGRLHVDEDASIDEQKESAMKMKWQWWVFLAAFLGGILDSFTPCVYPIIPVVISYMGAKSSGKKKAGFVLSLFFVIGLALTYSVVGLLASFLGGQFGMGSLASSPWVLGFVATVFLLLSLSMFGVYDINILSANKKTEMMQKDFAGPLGAMFLGGISGIIAAPCVGPVLAALLMHAALVGDMLYGWLLFLTFAFGLGILFLVIGTFSGAINALPNAGGWMMNIKKFFGVIMIAAAIYFLRIFMPDWLMYGIVGSLLILLASYLGAFRKIEEYDSFGNHLGKALGAISIIIGFLLLATTLNHFVELPFSGKGTLLVSSSVDSGNKSRVNFTKTHEDMNIVEKAVEKAKLEDKIVMVDFWAEWCMVCKELDKETWINPELIEFAEKNIIPVKIDFTDLGSDFSKKYAELYSAYRVNNPPVVIFLNGKGEVLGKTQGFLNSEKMLKKMKKMYSKRK